MWTFPGQIFTFFRGCAADNTNDVVEAGGFKEFTRSCTTTLCNDWDGISQNRPGGGSGGGGNGGGGGSGGSGNGGGDGSSGSGGSGSGDAIWMIEGIGPSGARNQQVDLYVLMITFSVVLKMFW